MKAQKKSINKRARKNKMSLKKKKQFQKGGTSDTKKANTKDGPDCSLQQVATSATINGLKNQRDLLENKIDQVKTLGELGRSAVLQLTSVLTNLEEIFGDLSSFMKTDNEEQPGQQQQEQQEQIATDITTTTTTTPNPALLQATTTATTTATT